MKKLIFLLFVLSLHYSLRAHPHVFVQTKISVVLNNSGIEKLQVAYTFDKIFSEELKTAFDTDKNGVFSPTEVAEIKAKAFSNLVKSNYFVHVFNGTKKVPNKKVSGFTAKIVNEQVVYYFTIYTDIPIGTTYKTIKIAPYDSSYYIDVSLDFDTSNVTFEQASAYVYSYTVKEEPQLAYYFEQVYPECINLIIKKK